MGSVAVCHLEKRLGLVSACKRHRLQFQVTAIVIVFIAAVVFSAPLYSI